MACQRRWSAAVIAFMFAGMLRAALLALLPPSALAASPEPATTTVTDLLGRQVQVHVPARRVILGEGRQLYLVAALDTENPIQRIVGWRKDLIQSDPDTYSAYLRKFPGIAAIPTFGGFEDGTFDIEQAISQKPDVIILNIEAQHATEDARYIEKLGALGIPVVYVDFRNDPMKNTEPTMRLFGKLFGKEDRAEAFIDFRARQIARVTDVIAAHQPARPKVFIERIGGYTQDCCLSFGNENFGKSAVSSVMPGYWAYAATLMFTGFAVVTMLTTANGYVQTTTDPALRGRVLALYMAILMGGTPIGAPIEIGRASCRERVL